MKMMIHGTTPVMQPMMNDVTGQPFDQWLASNVIAPFGMTHSSFAQRRLEDAPAGAGPVGVEELAARLVGPLVRVGAEVVALRLDQVRRQRRAAVAVEEGERRRVGRHRDARIDGRRDDPPPARLRLVHRIGEEGVEQEVLEARVTVEGGRIIAASIAQCWTRYSCSWVSHLPPQVSVRQSPNVDFVSGATESANAFYWAVVDALNKAKPSGAKGTYIKKISLSSTMGPGVKVDAGSLSA